MLCFTTITRRLTENKYTPPLKHRAKVRQKRETEVNYRPYLGTELSIWIGIFAEKATKSSYFGKHNLQKIPIKWEKIAYNLSKHVLQHIFMQFLF